FEGIDHGCGRVVLTLTDAAAEAEPRDADQGEGGAELGDGTENRGLTHEFASGWDRTGLPSESPRIRWVRAENTMIRARGFCIERNAAGPCVIGPGVDPA